MKELLPELSDAIHRGKPTDVLRERCTVAVLAAADDEVRCGNLFVRLARTLADGGVDGVGWLNSILTRAKDLRPVLRRHMLICAAREIWGAGKVRSSAWVRDLGCEEYMSLESDPTLIDGMRPHYHFAEFLCYANALLRGRTPTINDDFLHGGTYVHFTLAGNVEDVLGALGVEESDLDAHPHLRQWLAEAKAESRPPF